jgi:predicted regulator of Ras-like GTPase activity (Roadblock/LC7/MglB family)
MTADGAPGARGTRAPRQEVNMTPAKSELTWLLDELISRVPEIERAAILSSDGLMTAASASFDRDDAERLAAIAAGFHSLAHGTVRHLGAGRVRQTIVEMDSAFLFVSAAGQGSCVVVVSSAGSDVGLIAYETAVLVKRMSSHASMQPRAAAGGGQSM